MKLKENLKLRKIGNKYMIVDTNNTNVNMVDVYTMNETAATLWNEFATKEFTQEEMVNTLLQEYDVTQEKATADVNSLLKEWSTMGLMVND